VSNAPSKPVSFSRPKVGYFSNRPRTQVTKTLSMNIIKHSTEKYRTDDSFNIWINHDRTIVVLSIHHGKMRRRRLKTSHNENKLPNPKKFSILFGLAK
jgi:hypothetical protein